MDWLTALPPKTPQRHVEKGGAGALEGMLIRKHVLPRFVY